MKFQDDFYRLLNIEKEPEKIQATVALTYPHPVYEGHFPDRPVVPGVCTLTIVRELLSEICGAPVHLKEIRECKFVGMLVPSVGKRVGIDIVPEEEGRFRCIVKDGEKTVLKLKATMEERR